MPLDVDFFFFCRFQTFLFLIDGCPAVNCNFGVLMRRCELRSPPTLPSCLQLSAQDHFENPKTPCRCKELYWFFWKRYVWDTKPAEDFGLQADGKLEGNSYFLVWSSASVRWANIYTFQDRKTSIHWHLQDHSFYDLLDTTPVNLMRKGHFSSRHDIGLFPFHKRPRLGLCYCPDSALYMFQACYLML